MGLFNSMFGGNKETKEEKAPMPWRRLTELSQLDEIAEASKSKPQAIFKHSTTCGISRMVIRQLESQYDIDPSQLDIYYLDLKAYRAVSDEVGYRFQVMHQSPQMILIKNGTAVYADSHGAINAAVLESKL